MPFKFFNSSGQEQVGNAPLVLAGVILPYAGASAPGGFLLCDGATGLSTTTYADLFAVIGYTYGGSGATFSLPDLRGRVLVAKGTHVDVDALTDNDGLAVASRTPKHTHSVPAHKHAVSVSSSGNTDYTDTNHYHTSSDGYPFLTGGYAGAGADISTGGGGYKQQNSSYASGGANHRHSITNLAGSGTAGNTTDPSGDAALTSGSTTLPYIVVNYIIKT